MAKMYFYYSSMNAGKTTYLLQSSYNYRERGMNTFILAPSVDNRYETGKVVSRIGLEAPATSFSPDDNLFDLTEAELKNQSLHCVLVDEAQFLSKQQVYQLGDVADKLGVPVLAFGLRTDFQGELFEGSKYLLAWSDDLREIKTICHCGRKATMVVRLDGEGKAIKEGEQVVIGGNESYVSMCRQHYKEAIGV